MGDDTSFLELIEIHERRWGSEGYPGRPTLQELMECPIVAVWVQPDRFTLSIYENADQINEAITYLFTTPGPGNKKLVKIFYKQQPMNFTLQVARVRETPPPARQEDPQTQPEPRQLTDIKEVGTTRYGQSAPARNQLLPGRKSRHFKGR